MGSMSNSNPWSPYESYNDCSQGVCNIYCPQWCYLIFPPPPPSFFLDDEDDSSSSSTFSPLLIALIGILVSAFILISYYTLISKYCHHRRSSSEASERDLGGVFSSFSRQGNSNAAAASSGGGDGLNESMIKSIRVYKYRKGDGFIDGSDCSVCLSEFEEEESLRLLPKCNHAFHLPCIDTWLKSHSNCPLCRAFVTAVITPSSASPSVVVANQSSSVHPIASPESRDRGGVTAEVSSTVAGYRHQTGDSVVVIEDLEVGSRDGRSESQVQSQEEEQAKEEEVRQPIRRSASLDSGTVVSIADVLREIEDGDEERDQVSAGVGTSQQRREDDGYCEGKTFPLRPSTEAETAANQRSGVSSFLVRSSVAMKRSVSTGRFIFSRYDRARNYSLPQLSNV